MKIQVEISLDENLWGEYAHIDGELLMEDLFGNMDKDGIESIKLIKISE